MKPVDEVDGKEGFLRWTFCSAKWRRIFIPRWNGSVGLRVLPWAKQNANSKLARANPIPELMATATVAPPAPSPLVIAAARAPTFAARAPPVAATSSAISIVDIRAERRSQLKAFFGGAGMGASGGLKVGSWFARLGDRFCSSGCSAGGGRGNITMLRMIQDPPWRPQLLPIRPGDRASCSIAVGRRRVISHSLGCSLGAGRGLMSGTVLQQAPAGCLFFGEGLSRGLHSSGRKWFKRKAKASKSAAAEEGTAAKKPAQRKAKQPDASGKADEAGATSKKAKQPEPEVVTKKKPARTAKLTGPVEAVAAATKVKQPEVIPSTKTPAKKATKAKQPEVAVADSSTKTVAKKKPTKATEPEKVVKKKAAIPKKVKIVAQAKKPQAKASSKQSRQAKPVEVASPAKSKPPGGCQKKTDADVLEEPQNGGPLTGKAVVVVESPAKAKTIEKYLGDNYVVVASYGHVRDLAARSGSVRPQDDFDLVWEVPDTAKSRLNQIKAALKDAKSLVLASDPDREGEAIAWHVHELLKMDGVLKKGMIVQRVTFNEITRSAIQAGMESPRNISQALVDAYLARRALDYLIGFDISPVLWRKLPGSKSAGRVQSAALCLLAEREKEIESFTPREYWTVDAEISPVDVKGRPSFPARLTYYNSVKLDQFSLTGAEAEAAANYISKCSLEVESVKSSVVRRNAPGPYITSSLQQDASSKLGFGATKTMMLAQKLYEGVKLANDEVVGLITYMRTDSQQLSSQATESIRSLGAEKYGKKYVPETPRKFKSKIKNAQEAHEAIRPTDIRCLPSTLVDVLEPDGLRLYALIWRRTMACQLEQAIFNHVALDVEDPNGIVKLRSTAASMEFPGYQIVFKDKDALAVEKEDEDGEAHGKLPPLKVGSSVALVSAKHKQHFTEPPPRYTEGSLVRKMEELGIGRPSTYAHILKTLQSRQYTHTERQRIFPEIRGRMVAAFLSRYFTEFVDYGFTAKMEEQLDAISAGHLQWKDVLRQFWPDFHEKVASTTQVPNQQVCEMLADLFSEKLAGKNRTCPSCQIGELHLKLTRFGSGYFLGCSRYPACHYLVNLDDEEASEDEDSPSATASPLAPLKTNVRVLGVDPKSGLTVSYKEGPFGSYIQLGEDGKAKFKPKRIAVPVLLRSDSFDLESALKLCEYPKELGRDSEGREIIIGIGKSGCYIRRGGYSVFVPKEMKVEDLTLETALEIYEQGKVERRKNRKVPVRLEDQVAYA